MPSQVFKVKSIYEYVSQHDDDLHFPTGQIIDVTNEEDDEWYSGEYIDESGTKQEGIFPKNFVEKYEAATPPRPILANHPKNETESTSAGLDLTSAKLETPSTVENTPIGSAHVTIPLQQSPPQIQSPKTNVLGSSLVTPSKFHRSSPPSRIPSFEKPTPPPIFEKPASNSFKDRVAAFNKASSSIPGPLKPGGLASGDVSSFIKRPFIAPPPSKDAYIPFPRDHSVPSKFARREDDQNSFKKESERQIKCEKFSSEPTDLKGLISTDVKPTSLKERIALLQKQQMEQTPKLAEAAHRKDKVKRPVKKHVEPTTQVEANEQKIPISLEKNDTKEVSMIKSPVEDKVIPSEIHKSSDESLCPNESSGDGNDVDASRVNEDLTENGDKFKPDVSLKNRENDEKNILQSQDFDTKNKVCIEQEQDDEEDDNQDDEDEEEGEIDADIKRKEELRARMAKMSGGMNMNAMFGSLGTIPMSSVIIPKKKSNNPSNINDRKEESPISTPQKESCTAIPLPGMTQIKPQNVPHNENRIANLVVISPQASPKIDDIDSNYNQVTSSQGLPEEKSIPPNPKDNDSTTPLKSPADSDDELLPRVQNSSPTTLYTQQDHVGQKIEQSGLHNPLHIAEESEVEIDNTSPISPVNLSQNKRASVLPPPIPSGINSFQIDSQEPRSQESSTANCSPTSDRQTYSHIITPQIPSEDSDNNMSNESHQEDDMALNDHYVDISQAHNRALKNDNDLYLTSPIESSSSPHSTQLETFRKYPPKPLQLASNKRLSIDMPRSAPPPPPGKAPTWEKTDEDFETQSNPTPKKRAPSVPSSNATTPDYEKIEDDIYTASPPRSSYTMPERNPPPLPPRESVAPFRDSIDIERSM